jgi:hypothetical protein
MPITAYDTTFRGLGLLTISILPFLCLLQLVSSIVKYTNWVKDDENHFGS